MEPELKRMMQIGILVRNLDEAVKNYEKMGMGPWDITEMRNDQPPFDDMTFDGKEIEEKGIVMKTAMMTCYGFEIELIEPVADTQFKRWLDEHGPGIHHLAFDTKTPYETLLKEVKKNTGKDPWVRGYGIGGKMDFSYLDLRDELGIILECYGKKAPGKPALPFDTVGEFVPLEEE